MEPAKKKRRGRPLKEPGDNDSALAQRRARVRQAQRAFRRRKEDVLSSQARKITTLEKAVEDIINTFLELSKTMLQSTDVQVSTELVHSIHDATQRVLETARDAVPEDEEEGDGETPSKQEPAAEGNEAAWYDQPNLTNHARYISLPISSSSPMPPQVDNGYLWPQPIEEIYPAISQTQVQIPQTPIFTSAFLSHEFWAADYSTYTSDVPGSALHPHLSFWQRLLRISITSSYHALRGDPGYPTTRVAAQFRFSIACRPVGFILASARKILRQADYYDRSVEQKVAVPIDALFADQTSRIFGRDAKAQMVRLGEQPQDYIDASQVAEYLGRKGQCYYDGRVMEMALSVGTARKTVVRIDVQGLIERLTWAAVCMGDMVGYPKGALNKAIVASVVRMVG